MGIAIWELWGYYVSREKFLRVHEMVVKFTKGMAAPRIRFQLEYWRDIMQACNFTQFWLLYSAQNNVL